MKNEQEMVPQPRRSFDAPRAGAMSSTQGNRFDSPFGSPYVPRMSHYGSRPPFRQGTPYQQQQHLQYRSPAPNYAAAANRGTQYPPNWRGQSRAYSPYTYKSPQYMARGRGSFTPPDRSRGRSSYGSARSSQEEFDVNHYVIPAMTSNPWAKLDEEYYASREVLDR